MLQVLRSVTLAALATVVCCAAAPSAGAQVFTRASADALASATPQGRIFNGSIADIRSSPWQVLVYSDDGYSLTTCGGSIISATQVVTAAHCVSDVQDAGLIGEDPAGSGGLGVIAGISNYHGVPELFPYFDATPSLASTDHEEARTVEAASIHPGWPADQAGTDRFPSGDVAVITVDQPFDFTTPAVQPIALPPAVAPVDGEPIPVPTALRTVGFGQEVQYDAYGDDVSPDGWLYSQSLSVVDPDVCGFAIDGTGNDVDSAVNICGQTPTGTTCHGDSGSGLVTLTSPPVLVGLVSSGPDPCAAGQPTFFTSLVAPENQQFVAPPRNLAPPRAPRQHSLVALSHPTAMAVGGQISCSGGNFTSATQITWKITDEAGALVTSGVGTSLSYVLQSSDVGHLLSCRAYASSAGGVAVSNLAGGAPRVIAAPTPVPTAQPTPAPAVISAPATTKTTPASFSVAASAKGRRGKRVTVKVAVTALPAGVDTAIVSVPRLVKSKHRAGSPLSVTNYPKVGDAASRFALHLRVPRRAQTGTRTLPVKVFLYKLGTLVGSYTQSVRVKITR